MERSREVYGWGIAGCMVDMDIEAQLRLDSVPGVGVWNWAVVVGEAVVVLVEVVVVLVEVVETGWGKEAEADY